MKTLGIINIPIQEILCEFHVAPKDFSLPYDGILGIKLLSESKLRLDEGYLEINNKKFTLHKSIKNNTRNEKTQINFHKTADSNKAMIDQQTYNTLTLHNKCDCKIIYCNLHELKMTQNTSEYTKIIKQDFSQQFDYNDDKTNSYRHIENHRSKDTICNKDKSHCQKIDESTESKSCSVNIDSLCNLEIAHETSSQDIQNLLNTISILHETNNKNQIQKIGRDNIEKTLKLEYYLQQQKNTQDFLYEINTSLESTLHTQDGKIENLDYSTFLSTLQKNSDYNLTTNEMKHLKNINHINYITLDILDIPQDYYILHTYPEPSEEESIYLGCVNLFDINDKRTSSINNHDRQQTLLNKLDLQNLTRNQTADIQNLIIKNQDVFWLENEKLTQCNVEQHEINLTDDKPIYVKQFPLPFKLKETAVEEGEKLIKNDLVKKSKSPWNAPAFLVDKKGLTPDLKKKYRLVIDYRKLNEKTIPDPYLLPNISEIFDEIGKNKYYTTLDLSSGFHQIKMRPQDTEKTAFSIHPLGRLEFLVLPFGLMNSPRTFQRVMNTVLQDLIGKICYVYIDDIIIFAKNIEEHNERFNLIAERLRKANLKLEPTKCKFLQTEILFLGHVISELGVKPESSKIVAVKNFKSPKNIKNVQEFLGLANYYRKFIKNFADISKPLTNLLRKNIKFSWGELEEKAFNELKNILCSEPILQFPDFKKPFNVTCDASSYAIGAILSQGPVPDDLPISFASRVLKGPELNYHTYEKEALAIKFGIETFRNYIYGNKFTVYTDHRPLLSLKSADKNSRVQKWRLKLADYDFDIIYKPGKKNTNVDALSRNPTENAEICIMTRAQKARQTHTTPLLSNELKVQKLNDQRTVIKNKKSYKKRQKNDTQTKSQLKNNNNEKLTQTSQLLSHNSKINPTFQNIVYIKESINLRNDNIIHLISKSKSSLDVNTHKLIKSQNIIINDHLQHNEIEVTNVKNKKLFTLCLDIAKSKELIKQDLLYLFNQLKNILIKEQQNMVSISKEINITNIIWDEIEEILFEVFKNTEIKIMVCLNLIKYVELCDRDEIFNQNHSSVIGGHSGINRTYVRIKNKYVWENLKRDIQERIKNCDTCQRNKTKRNKTKQPLFITDTPYKCFEKISLDVVGPLNVTKNNNKYILTIQDHLSKFLILAPLKDQTAETVADTFIKKFICIFSSPKIVLTDNGKNFVSKLMKTLAKRFKFTKIETTAFHPASNGSLERQHAPICEFLKNFSSKQIEWDEILEMAQFHLNCCCINSSHSFTPYEVVFACPPRLPSSEPLKKSEQLPTFDNYLENLITNMQNIAKLARENLIEAKEKSKLYYDKKIKPVNFEIGDQVWWPKEPKPGKLEKNHNLGPFEIQNITQNGDIVVIHKGKHRLIHPNKLILHKKKN